MMTFTKPALGSGYEIEWCESCPDDGFGGLDIDQAAMVVERFATLEEARKVALERLSQDVFGAVLIRDFFWQAYDEYDLPYFGHENGSYIEEVS